MMEMFGGQTYQSIMSMPVTRRYRMVRQKQDLEKRRAKK